MADKINTYLGFALRARKITLGVNAIKAERGKVYLLLADLGASENTKREIGRLKEKFQCPLYYIEDLEGRTGKAYCKLAALREEELARAIVREFN